MSSLAQELDDQLRRMDPETARHVEQVIRETLLIAARRTEPRDEMGYPLGYFEKVAGSFASEPLERGRELPLEKREEW